MKKKLKKRWKNNNNNEFKLLVNFIYFKKQKIYNINLYLIN